MQYIEQQLTEFKAEFARRRKRQLLVTIPLVAGVVLLRVFRTEEGLIFGLPASTVMGAAFAVVMAVLAFSLWNWRCPACNKYLGKGISPAFCRKCGVPLQ